MIMAVNWESSQMTLFPTGGWNDSLFSSIHRHRSFDTRGSMARASVNQAAPGGIVGLAAQALNYCRFARTKYKAGLVDAAVGQPGQCHHAAVSGLSHTYA